MPSEMITNVLSRINAGEQRAANELLPLVYDELRRLARVRMAQEKPGQTIGPTALVHEAYLRLVGDDDPSWGNRAHFFSAAAEAMRRILIERARRRARYKHGGGQLRVTFDEQIPGDRLEPESLLALDEALDRLEVRDPRMANVVKLRYFAGLSLEETGKTLDLSIRSVTRTWTGARAWLHAELSRGSA